MPTSASACLVLISVPMPAGHLVSANQTAPRVGENFPLLVAGKNFLGRAAGAVIVLPWIHVSRQQAVIEFFLPGSWEIEDLQSRNGTFVNGQRLSCQTLVALSEGDRICVGAPPGAGAVELMFTCQPTSQLTPQEEL